MAERVPTDTLARQIFLRTMNPTRSFLRGGSRLAEAMEDVFLSAGETVYRQGEAAERIYFVVTGKVALRAEGKDDWIMDERSVIGVIDANLDRPRARTAVTLTDVHMLMLRADDYFEVIEDNFEQARNIVFAVTSGLRGLITSLAPTGGFVEPASDSLEPADARPVTPVERIIVMRSVPAFHRASIQALTTLADLVRELRVPAGAMKERPGGRNGALLIVARGIVEMVREDPPMRARFASKSIIGGISTLAEEAEKVRLEAIGPALVFELREEDLFDVMEDHFDLVRSLLAHGALERERLMVLKGASASGASRPAIDATASTSALPARV